ncbi:MAG: hypothetical protein P8Z79_13015 [Sedimentisphaerales bacterium]|jgi:hypothetical protein
MVNTLRITSVLAAILAAVFFVFPIIYGIHSDKEAKEFLDKPDVRETFEKGEASRISKGKDVTPPLVQQAQAFANYLNPKPTAKASRTFARGSKSPPAYKVTPKFKLICTSYCASDPNMSLALIDEPGQGRHWVKQSGKVGHLLINQIKDGRIVVKGGGEENFELAIDESSVKEAPAASKPASPQTRFSSRLTTSSKTRPTFSRPSTTVLREQKNNQGNESEDEENDRDARARALIEKLRSLQKSTVSGKSGGADDKEKAARIEKLISQYQSTRISPEEAKKLGNLGKTLQKDPDPNRTPSETGKSR